MARRKVYPADLNRGLNTTGHEDGLRLPNGWPVLDNVEFDEGGLQRRKGIQRIDSVPSPHTALDLAAASTHHVVVPKYGKVQHLKKAWTLAYLINPDAVSGTQVLHGFAHASDFPVRVYLNGDVVTADVQDEDSTTVTLTSSAQTATKLAVMVIRDGTGLELWVNGVQEDTDTMADKNCASPGGDMYFARDNTGNYLDGLYDFAWALDYAVADQREGKMRLVDPRAKSVLWSYNMEIAEATSKRVNDDSRYGNHGIFVGTAATGSAQTVQVTPVNLLHDYLDDKNRNRLAVLAGQEMFLGEIKA